MVVTTSKLTDGQMKDSILSMVVLAKQRLQQNAELKLLTTKLPPVFPVKIVGSNVDLVLEAAGLRVVNSFPLYSRAYSWMLV